MSAIDEANIAFEEAFREPRAQSHEGPLDYEEDYPDDDDMDPETLKACRELADAWDDGREEDERQSKRGKQ